MSHKNNDYIDYFLQGFFLRKEIIQVLKCLSKYFNEGNLAKKISAVYLCIYQNQRKKLSVQFSKYSFIIYNFFFTFLLAYFVQNAIITHFRYKFIILSYLINIPSITGDKHIVLNYLNKEVLEYRIIMLCFLKKEQIGYLT